MAAANAQRAPVLSVAEYGQLGTSNDAATFQAALNAAAAGGATVVAPPGSYRVTGLRVDSGVKVWFPGVTLVNIGLSCITLRSGDTSEVLIYGVEIDGSEAQPGSHGIVVRGNHNRVTGVFVHDIPRLGITVTASAPSTEHNTVDHCRAYRCGQHGINVASGAVTARHVTIYANHVKDCVRASISITGELVVVSHNVTEETTAPSEVAADSLTGYSVGDAGLLCVGNSFYTSHNNGVHLGGARLSITGNLIIEPAQAGIYVAEHLENGAALPSSDFVISDNTIVSPGVRDGGSGYGVYAERASGGVIAGNEIAQPRTHGIALEECDGVGIAANTVRGSSVGSGVLLSRCRHVAVGGNALCDSVHGDGILVEDLGAPASSDLAIAQNVVSGNLGGIRVAGGAAGRLVLAGNAIGGNEGPAVSLDGAAAKTAANVTETADTVASAPTLGVSRDLSLVTVTGRNTVRALSDDSAEVGRVLALRFSDGCLVTTGGNIVMPRSFAAPENGMLVLVCDGTKWYEATRSTPAG